MGTNTVVIHPEAHAYADVHNIPLPEALPVRSQTQAGDAFQLVCANGLALQPLQLGNVKPIHVDFVAGALAHRRKFGGGVQQDIAKACGLHQIRTLHILDATAGLGRDAFVLASLGARLTLMERHPIVFALLFDGLQRAQNLGDTDVQSIVARMHLLAGSATDHFHSEPLPQQVLYLDPMFPPRQKAAKVKVDMQSLHELVGIEDDADALLAWGFEQSFARIVVKRPRLADALLRAAPSHHIIGKANRFDVYALNKLTSA